MTPIGLLQPAVPVVQRGYFSNGDHVIGVGLVAASVLMFSEGNSLLGFVLGIAGAYEMFIAGSSL